MHFRLNFVGYFRAAILAWAVLLAPAALAGENYLEPWCKQGFCSRTKLSAVEPVRFGSSGIVMSFEYATADLKCDEGKATRDQECFSKRPSDANFSRPSRGMALCSVSIPTLAVQSYSQEEKSTKRFEVFSFNPADRIYGNQSWAADLYFTICHGWQPRGFGDVFEKFVAAKGYKKNPSGQVDLPPMSEAELDDYFEKSVSPRAVSIAMLKGRWYVENSKVCEGEPGETEGLLIFTEREFDGMESFCKIQKAQPQGLKLKLSLRCEGEGMTSNVVNVFELINGRQIKSTTTVGRQQFSSIMTKCP